MRTARRLGGGGHPSGVEPYRRVGHPAFTQRSAHLLRVMATQGAVDLIRRARFTAERSGYAIAAQTRRR